MPFQKSNIPHSGAAPKSVFEIDDFKSMRIKLVVNLAERFVRLSKQGFDFGLLFDDSEPEGFIVFSTFIIHAPS
jgi:hypothetical protein